MPFEFDEIAVSRQFVLINLKGASFVRRVALLFDLSQRVLPDIEICLKPSVERFRSQNVEQGKPIMAGGNVNANREVAEADVEEYTSIFLAFHWNTWASGVFVLTLMPIL
jgi:hypothetical protein